MTESEWLNCRAPEQMLETLDSLGRLARRRGWARRLLGSLARRSDPTPARKVWLFMAACCRRLGHRLGERALRVLEVAERLADGLADTRELRRACGPDPVVLRYPDELVFRAFYPLSVLSGVPERVKASVCADALIRRAGCPGSEAMEAERRAVEALIRCLFGNPFRPVGFDPAWRTGNVVAVAQGVYDDQAFDRLPVLADALTDAGCADDAILGHCRAAGPHARGCWVVDGALRKE